MSSSSSSSEEVSSSSSSSSRLCQLCRSSASDLELDLQLLRGDGRGEVTSAHYMCLLFSSGLHQRGCEDEGLRGFLSDDVRKELKRGARLKCVYCKASGATVGCAKAQCKKSYHLPCGMRNKSLQQHFDQFKSFCSSHRPVQKVKTVGGSSSCGICTAEDLDPKASFSALRGPCCGKWFHRSCLQKMALTSGSYHFRCPLCNNAKVFTREMLQFGIHVPTQDALWEEQQQRTDDPPARQLTCSAKMCISERPEGREYNVSDGLWEILGCTTCGSSGIHVKCGGLEAYVDPDWYCYVCRRVVDQERENRKMARPIREVWGSAAATRSGVHKSGRMQREELLETIQLTVHPQSRPLQQPAPPAAHPPPVSRYSHLPEVDITLVVQQQQQQQPQVRDPMSVTLEDLIVSGLNREYNRGPPVGAAAAQGSFCSAASGVVSPGATAEEQEASPGDSDYESAQEVAAAAGIPFKIRKKSKVAKLSEEGDVVDGETLDQKIQKTIKTFFSQV